MNITFVTQGSLDELIGHLNKLRAPDVLLLAEGVLPELYLLKEAEGESGFVVRLCALSEQLECAIVAGCDTLVCDILHKSAVVVDRGRLLGVSDMANVLDETGYYSGGGFRVYDTPAGKLGVIVGEDLFFPEVARILTLCDAEVLLCPFGKISSPMPQVMMRAAAFSNGVNVCMAAAGCVQIADLKGEMIALPTAMLEFNMEIIKDFHLISARRRGCYREIYSAFEC